MQLNEDQRRAVQTALEVAECAGHMSLMGSAGTGKTTTIRAPSDDAHPAWKWLKNIRDDCFGDVSSAFATTVHKSQGSTYKHVYVDRDLLIAEEDRNSLLYVAATRASESVTFGGANG